MSDELSYSDLRDEAMESIAETEQAREPKSMEWSDLRSWIDRVCDDVEAQQSYEWRSIKLDHYARQLAALTPSPSQGFREWRERAEELVDDLLDVNVRSPALRRDARAALSAHLDTLPEVLVSDAGDAARWRALRPHLDVDGDLMDESPMGGDCHVQWITYDEKVPAQKGWTHTVESIIDAYRAAPGKEER